MIDDILDYIAAYDNIRAVTGLNRQELPDTTLALAIYRHKLGAKLSEFQGVYADASPDIKNLQETYDLLDAEPDDMHSAIQLYAIYCVADAVLDSVGLRAYKSESDGKATMTRFSPQSTYEGVVKAIKWSLAESIALVQGMFDNYSTPAGSELLTVVSPAVDLVIGE